MTPTILEALAKRGLLPPELRTGPGSDPDRLLPSGPRLALQEYRGKYQGTLVGGAIGDALGRPAEGRWPEKIQARYGVLKDFQPWRGWKGGPKGTITDDTQMSMCVAETLVEHGHLDPEDLARRFVDWLPIGRGKGRSCTAAVLRLTEGIPWYEAGVASAGNGAAMRAAPVGLRYPCDVSALRRDAALSAVVTHADSMAAASAIAVGFATSYLLHLKPGELDPSELVRALETALEDVPDPGHPERKPGCDDRPVPLRERIGEIPDFLGEPPDRGFGYFYNGAFVLESLPAALWCFLDSPEDPERVLLTAVNGGHDADTVAAMAGNLAGAYHGEDAFPDRWRDDLEFAEELRELADGLFDRSGLADAPQD
jgi:ADP-ribosylglycohydrolase